MGGGLLRGVLGAEAARAGVVGARRDGRGEERGLNGGDEGDGGGAGRGEFDGRRGGLVE